MAQDEHGTSQTPYVRLDEDDDKRANRTKTENDLRKMLDDPKWFNDKNSVLYSFIFMSLMLSLNNASNVVSIGIASTVLPLELAGHSTAVLYILYTASAMFGAVYVNDKLGIKKTLVVSLFMYCFYVGAYLLALQVQQSDPNLAYGGAIFGGAISGVGAGWMWTAQGIYFGRAAHWYAKASRRPMKEVTGFLAGIFAAINVGCEVILKILWKLSDVKGEGVTEGCKEPYGASLEGETIAFIVFFVVAVLSAFGMLFVRTMPNPSVVREDKRDACQQIFGKIAAAGSLMWTDTNILLLGGLNVTFGIGVSFINFYLNKMIGAKAVGTGDLGWLLAILAITAFILQYPYTKLTSVPGAKMWMMIFGVLNYAVGVIICMAIPEALARGWSFELVLVYMLFGSGRGLFEGINKAVFADFFPQHQLPDAFANVTLQNGLFSGIFFFVWPAFQDWKYSDSCDEKIYDDLNTQLATAVGEDDDRLCLALQKEIASCRTLTVDNKPIGILIQIVAALSVVFIWFAFWRRRRQKFEHESSIDHGRMSISSDRT